MVDLTYARVGVAVRYVRDIRDRYQACARLTDPRAPLPIRQQRILAKRFMPGRP
ncbi:MAG: hypothetical protein U5S82_22755 [Gammaproteobacteria bacterium]|nr:hypothetical protein [Gammaproteobacteria bacterium]